MNPSTQIVVPWHNPSQRDAFLAAWGLNGRETFLVLQQDKDKSGCALTKNKGIENAIKWAAKVIIVLDDDCFPLEGQTIQSLIADHENALKPIELPLYEQVTEPASRGTPYFTRTVRMPVAASMGFWTEIGDYDAPGQLVHGATRPMEFSRKAIFGKYFPLCGMNLAFRAEEYPWCKFINVERFDDIWQGYLWQRKAYADGKCFNLAGPLVRHSRQSNVWHNLRAEAVNLEQNESVWQRAATLPLTSYEQFRDSVLPKS
jgi:hypothetical protein